MLRLLSMTIYLAALWLLLSGHFSGLMLSFGLASVLITLLIAHRMETVDPEGHPAHLSPGILLYLPWLVFKIIQANLDVTRRILSPSLPISPVVDELECTQKTDFGKTLYANSITLTPGTLTINVSEDENRIRIHALTSEGAHELREGEMDRKVTRALGE